MRRYILIALCCLIVLVSQTYIWMHNDVADIGLWAKAAQSVQAQSPDTYPLLDAYMHPGGSVIEGTILVHNVSSLPYEASLRVFVIVIDCALIFAICFFCFILRPEQLLWPALTALILSTSPLFYGSTVPSSVASLLTVFLCIFFLYLYEHHFESTKGVLSWFVGVGLLVATRVDIGLVVGILFGLPMFYYVDNKRRALVLVVTTASFVLFDPFMWSAPFLHIRMLLESIMTHYSTHQAPPVLESTLDVPMILCFTILALMGAFLGLFQFFSYKEWVPRMFIGLLLLMTALVVGVVVTAHSAALRYLQPVAFVWETFLVLFLLTIISTVRDLPVERTTAGSVHGREIFLKLAVCFVVVIPALVFWIS